MAKSLLPRARRQDDTPLTTADLERLKAGFDPSSWNAAIRLQCALRDQIDRPVTLQQTFELLATWLREFRGSKRDAMILKFLHELDQQAEERKRARELARAEELAQI